MSSDDESSKAKLSKNASKKSESSSKKAKKTDKTDKPAEKESPADKVDTAKLNASLDKVLSANSEKSVSADLKTPVSVPNTETHFKVADKDNCKKAWEVVLACLNKSTGRFDLKSCAVLFIHMQTLDNLNKTNDPKKTVKELTESLNVVTKALNDAVKAGGFELTEINNMTAGLSIINNILTANK